VVILAQALSIFIGMALVSIIALLLCQGKFKVQLLKGISAGIHAQSVSISILTISMSNISRMQDLKSHFFFNFKIFWSFRRKNLEKKDFL